MPIRAPTLRPTSRSELLTALAEMQRTAYVNMTPAELTARAGGLQALVRSPSWRQLQPDEQRQFGAEASRIAHAMAALIPRGGSGRPATAPVVFVRPLSQCTNDEIERTLARYEGMPDHELMELGEEALMAIGQEIVELRESARWPRLALAQQSRVNHLINRLHRMHTAAATVVHPVYGPSRGPAAGVDRGEGRPYVPPAQMRQQMRDVVSLGPFASLAFGLAMLGGQPATDALVRAHQWDAADRLLQAAGEAGGAFARAGDVIRTQPPARPSLTPETHEAGMTAAVREPRLGDEPIPTGGDIPSRLPPRGDVPVESAAAADAAHSPGGGARTRSGDDEPSSGGARVSGYEPAGGGTAAGLRGPQSQRGPTPPIRMVNAANDEALQVTRQAVEAYMRGDVRTLTRSQSLAWKLVRGTGYEGNTYLPPEILIRRRGEPGHYLFRTNGVWYDIDTTAAASIENIARGAGGGGLALPIGIEAGVVRVQRFQGPPLGP